MASWWCCSLRRRSFASSRRAYAIISMVYAWLDNCKLFKKHLDTAVRLVEIMHNNGEEVPLVRRANQVLSLVAAPLSGQEAIGFRVWMTEGRRSRGDTNFHWSFQSRSCPGSL